MLNEVKSRSAGKCPVCGMEIDERSARKVEYNGQTYFVASEDCKARFQADPAKYAGKAAESGPTSSHGHHGGGHGCC
jgi:Cu+-exporting ATPase